MADGKIEIEARINSKDIDKDLSDLKKKINNVSGGDTQKSVKGLSSSFSSLGLTVAGVSAGVATAAKVVSDLTASYRVQEHAEKLLESAAKNNPYLNGHAVEELKSFASEMQRNSVYGDEQLIQLIGGIANGERKAQELMAIIKASADIASTGIISIDSAVRNLNLSYSGQLGSLKKLVPELGNLTEAELKNGAAVKVVLEKYSGMAKEMAAATGTSEQLKNSFGDLKEALGYSFEEALKPVRKFFTELFSNIANTISDSNKLKKALKIVDEQREESSVVDIDNAIKGLYAKIEQRKVDLMNSIGIVMPNDKVIENYNKKIEEYNHLLEIARDREAKEAASNQYSLELKKAEALNKAIQDRYQSAVDNYNNTINKVKEELAIRKQLGEEITEEAEAQELLNSKTQAYIDMRVAAGSSMSDNNSFAKDAVKDIKDTAAKIKLSVDTKEAEEVYREVVDDFKNIIINSLTSEVSIDEQFAEKKRALEVQYAMLTAEDKKAVYADYQEALTRLDKARAEAARDIELQEWDNRLSNVNDYLDKYTALMTTLTNQNLKIIELESNNRLSEIDRQYEQGIISEQEYEEKRKQIQREAAQASYKQQLWQWTAQVAQIGINTASAIVNALSTAGNIYAGIAMAAIVGAMGGAQLGIAAANRPKPPSFEKGGIVPGASYSGDNVIARVNSGEMILTRNQQASLWNMLSGKSSASSGINMTINNSVSDKATVNARRNNDGAIILDIIDRQVTKGLATGTYDDALSAKTNRDYGVVLL